MRTVLFSPNAKKALAVLLVLVVVVTGLPVVMGMSGMAECPDCDTRAVCPLGCQAVLFAVTVLSLAVGWALRPHAQRRYGLAFAWSLDPPPRLA